MQTHSLTTELPRRRGFTLLELMLALTLLGLFAALLSPLLMASARERRVAIQEQLALQLAANQLERATLSPWMPTPTLVEVPVPPELARWLPDVKQTVAVTTEDHGTRVVVMIIWQSRPGVTHRPVVLEGWAIPTGGTP
jgi:prepilin-type N-terminal cleavage/methylation domain-containing protein